VTPDVWADKIIGPSPDGWGFFVQGKANDRGYQSICTPGTVRGLAMLLERWGTISWAQAIAPAARIAAEGFVVDEHLANRWKTKAKYAEGLLAPGVHHLQSRSQPHLPQAGWRAVRHR